MVTESRFSLRDEQLLRYNRQIMLPEVDLDGQVRLLASRVLVVGLGGLGCPAAIYLATSGVGHITLVDPDRVELSNLQRQIAHTSDRVGQDKVASAAEMLRALNPDVAIEQHNLRLDEAALLAAAERADVVVDATDNLEARYAINRACHRTRTPLVVGAVIRVEGQVSVYPFARDDDPCFACLYHDVAEPPATCAETGVLAPVAGIIGCIQATETIKLLVGFGETLGGRLLLVDGRSMSFETISLLKNPSCPVCSGG
jgi:molybdopterin/thiamine biosynthesis adenylyltransferase